MPNTYRSGPYRIAALTMSPFRKGTRVLAYFRSHIHWVSGSGWYRARSCIGGASKKIKIGHIFALSRPQLSGARQICQAKGGFEPLDPYVVVWVVVMSTWASEQDTLAALREALCGTSAAKEMTGRLVLVSNRVPASVGAAQAGGLAVAVEELLHQYGGLWLGWSGVISARGSKEAVRRQVRGAVEYVTLDFSRKDYSGYYNGFANGVLWPLLHTLPELVTFDQRDAATYYHVNARLADALLPLLRPGDVIWVHDYHLFPLPRLLRARGVEAPIGFFLHTPFPGPDVIGLAPAVVPLVRDVLAADLIGFQTTQDLQNFAAAAERFAGTRAYASEPVLEFGRRQVRLGVFPVEINGDAFAAAAARSVAGPAAQRLSASLGTQSLILGIDRLDPTKGLLQRLAGLRRLFERYPEWRRRATLLQIAALSRQDVASYRALKAALDCAAGSLNAEFGEPDWVPLRLLSRAGQRETIAGFMRLARVGLVTPLRDGMNLVAKEYVAAQDPADPGVLVLSRFAGAAQQLDAALLVNPHDPEEIADALHRALGMPQDERRARWQALHQSLAGASSLTWGQAFLSALTRARAEAASNARAGLMQKASPAERRQARLGFGSWADQQAAL